MLHVSRRKLPPDPGVKISNKMIFWGQDASECFNNFSEKRKAYHDNLGVFFVHYLEFTGIELVAIEFI